MAPKGRKVKLVLEENKVKLVLEENKVKLVRRVRKEIQE